MTYFVKKTMTRFIALSLVSVVSAAYSEADGTVDAVTCGADGAEHNMYIVYNEKLPDDSFKPSLWRADASASNISFSKVTDFDSGGLKIDAVDIHPDSDVMYGIAAGNVDIAGELTYVNKLVALDDDGDMQELGDLNDANAAVIRRPITAGAFNRTSGDFYLYHFNYNLKNFYSIKGFDETNVTTDIDSIVVTATAKTSPGRGNRVTRISDVGYKDGQLVGVVAAGAGYNNLGYNPTTIVEADGTMTVPGTTAIIGDSETGYFDAVFADSVTTADSDGGVYVYAYNGGADGGIYKVNMNTADTDEGVVFYKAATGVPVAKDPNMMDGATCANFSLGSVAPTVD